SEGRRRLAAALSLAPIAEQATRATVETAQALALAAAGHLAYRQGEHDTARSLTEHALAIWRKQREQRRIAAALTNLGNIAHAGGDFTLGRSFYEESLEIYRALDMKPGIAVSAGNLGNTLHHLGDGVLARALYDECLTLARELGDTTRIAWVLNAMG